MTRDRLTVVVAAFNEAPSLPELHRRLAAVLDAMAAGDAVDGRVLYVDDGSTDATWQVLQSLMPAVLRKSSGAPAPG